MSGAPTVPSLPPTASPPTPAAVAGLATSPPEATLESGAPDAAPLFAELLRSQLSGRFSVKAEAPPVLETAPAADVGKAEPTGAPLPADALAAIMPLLLAQMAQNTPPASQNMPAASPPGVATPRAENASGKAPGSAPLLAVVAERSATATDGSVLPATTTGDGTAAAPKAATISLVPANVATEAPARGLPESRTPGFDNNAFQAALASAQGLAAAPVAHGGANRMPELPIAAPLGAPGWDRQVGDKLTWMVSRQESNAALVLTPPQLGRIEVSISLSGDQANAVFVSQNPAVREALEAALPRLRETLADAGINLGQAQVGSDAPPPRGEERRDNPAPRARAASDGEEGRAAVAVPAAVPSWIASGRGMVDTFA